MKVLASLSLFVFCIGANAQAAIDPELQDLLNRNLRQAAMSGLIAQIEELHKQGADLNSKAPHGECALEYAIRFGRWGAAFKLIELGADVNSQDDNGLSPLMRAADDCNGSRAIETLLKAGADVNMRDYYGRTALMRAVHADCVRSVAVLLVRAKDSIKIDVVNDALETAGSLAQNGIVPTMLDLARQYQQGSKSAMSTLQTLK